MSIIARLKLDHLRFRQQLIVIFCFGLILVTPLTSYIISATSNDILRKQLYNQGMQIARTLATQSKLALLYESEYTAQESVNFVSGFPDAEVLEIRPGNAKAIYQAASLAPRKLGINYDDITDIQSYEFDDEWIFVLAVMSQADTDVNLDAAFMEEPDKQPLLGHVTVAMSKNTLFLLQRKAFQTNLALSFLLAVIAAFILIRVTRRITQPIERLAQTMRQAEEGDTSVRAELKGQPDVTVMQQAFNTMMDVLEKREKELEQARDNAVENARLKGEFVANVTHELRTPMNAVLGMLDLLRESNLSPRNKEYVGVASSSGESLLGLIDDILDFSKIDAGKIVVNTAQLDLKELIEDVIRLLASQALSKNVDIGYFIDFDIVGAIPLDRSRVQQVLINLIGNAIKFTESGEVSLTVRQNAVAAKSDETELLFEIKDSGIGINEDDQKKIFEAFTQADSSSTREYAGTGLGLTISKQIVELLGGEIGLTSQIGKGSTFWFTLPFTDTTLSITQAQQDTQDSKSIRALLITRSAIIMRFSQKALSLNGVVCSTTTSYREASDLIKQAAREASPFDYLFVDEDNLFLHEAEFKSIFASHIDQQLTTIVVLSNPFKRSRVREMSFSVMEKPLLSSSFPNLIKENKKPTTTTTGTSRLPLVTASYRNTRVLVVDDNTVNQQVAREMLLKLGCKSDSAINGKYALEMVLKTDYDLILMDCNMPVMDGYDSTREIRRLEGSARIPIIAMTANDNEDEQKKCELAGMSSFLVKPLRLGTLADELSRWLSDKNTSLIPVPQSDTDIPVDGAENYDRAFLKELFESVGEVGYRMIEAFIEDTPIYIDSMKNALAEGNAKQVRELAHTVKGSASNFGAHPLTECAKLIEQLAHKDQLTECGVHIVQLVVRFEELRVDLENNILKNVLDDLSDHSPTHSLLIVDDDRTIRLALKDVFKGKEFETIEASNGRQAIEICRRSIPDVILMDAIMPETGGFQACRAIRELPNCADIPILIITSLEDEEAIVEAFASGATDYITKPLHFVVLKERVSRLIDANKVGKKIKEMAYHDSLTGLPNRARLMQELRVILDRSLLDKKRTAVLFIDLDNFKDINDSLGHNVGDLLLKVVADRLRGCVRETDFIARLGGDEFTVILEDVENNTTVSKVAETICESLNEPFVFLQKKMFVSASIGISIFPEDANDINALLKHADLAMFEAKKNKNHFIFYRIGMEDEISHRLEIEQQLRLAIENDELILHYQPQYDIETGKVVAAETLVRWQHPTQGLLGPGKFIPIAEQSDLIIDVTRWVISQSVRQIARWSEKGFAVNLSVNLSGKDLDSTGLLVDHLNQLANEYQIDTSLLELEITESILMGDPESSRRELLKLKDLGYTLAIDDFGTGYSSLNYLKNLPVDTLKIDQIFIKGITECKEDYAIAKGIIALANSLELNTIAEGVETIEQQELISALGCNIIQGFLISKPLPIELFEAKYLSGFKRANRQSNTQVS